MKKFFNLISMTKSYLYPVGLVVYLLLFWKFGLSSDVVTVRPAGLIIFALLGAIPFILRRMRAVDELFFYAIIFLASQGVVGLYVCSTVNCGMAGLFILIPLYLGGILLPLWGLIAFFSRKRRRAESRAAKQLPIENPYHTERRSIDTK